MRRQMKAKVPVTVITGFLGSGKTTLLNRLLKSQAGRPVAVVVNEYGEIGIDSKLLYRSEEQIIEFNNGCICCTVRQDLINMLTGMCERNDLKRVIIETTGLADPAPVASTFFIAQQIREHFDIDAFITVVDACNALQNLRDSKEALEQIMFADVIVINKLDTVTPESLIELEQTVKRINPLAKVYAATNCALDTGLLLDINAFSLQAKLEVDPAFLEDIPHQHDNSVGSIVLTEQEPIDLNYFQAWMSELLRERGGDIYRSKGVFYGKGFKERMVFQSVRMLRSLEFGEKWKEDEIPRTEFVVIGRNLDRKIMEKGLRNCVHKPHASSR